MPRTPRIQPGGYVFHALNRGNGRMTIFECNDDYAAFERVMHEVVEDTFMRLLAYCLMPNHWHLVLRPREDGDLGRFMQRLTSMHVRRWHKHRQTTGYGHLYQGTYKSFPVATDGHFLRLCRYVERNALRAGLVNRAEDWQWCSLWRRRHPAHANALPQLSRWPVQEPTNWLRLVNQAPRTLETDTIRTCLLRGRPFGSETWQKRIAGHLGLEATLRPRGRPRQDARE